MTDTAAPPRTSALTWFEIATADIDRARRFYETILETTLVDRAFGTARIAVFPYDRENGTGGCLVQGPEWKPCSNGTVVYLDCDGRLDRTLERVPAAGGRIALAKTALPEGMGYIAHIFDSEGNRVGLHAMS